MHYTGFSAWDFPISLPLLRVGVQCISQCFSMCLNSDSMVVAAALRQHLLHGNNIWKCSCLIPAYTGIRAVCTVPPAAPGQGTYIWVNPVQVRLRHRTDNLIFPSICHYVVVSNELSVWKPVWKTREAHSRTEIDAVQCPRIQSALTETIMFDPKAQVKGYLAIVNMIGIMMNDSKWLSVLGCQLGRTRLGLSFAVVFCDNRIILFKTKQQSQAYSSARSMQLLGSSVQSLPKDSSD